MAFRLRPDHFEDIQGQEHILKENSLFKKLVNSGNPFSIMLWGPSGSGKTTMAHVVSRLLENSHFFVTLSAVQSGVKDIKEITHTAKEKKSFHGKHTILFIDEIHHFNRSQQDTLLPHVESGLISLIGATTENPSFYINSALLSRSHIFTLKKLTKEQLFSIVSKAIEKTYGEIPESENLLYSLEMIADFADGDARKALNLLEVFLEGAKDISELEALTPESLKKLITDKTVRYDRDREDHYDTISAFIKSVRGSDPDAAVYYLARMLEGGEDPRFIARRLIILASEDIGNADPRGLSVAVAGKEAVEFIGMPESRIILSQVTTYLASAPKSNRSYKAISEAQQTVKETGNLEIPLHIRNAPTKLMKNLGYGKNYIYPHDYENSIKKQDYLPEEIQDSMFYKPSESGFEKNIRERLNWIRKQQ